MSINILGLIETISHQYRRSVSVTMVYRTHSWRAECAGVIAQSLVGPEDALKQLSEALTDANLSTEETAAWAKAVVQ